MSSKQNIILHLDGINACEKKEYEHALKLFMRISEPSAPIFFNMGCCYLKLNNNSEALKMFRECVTRDKYLAIGQFQLAVAETLCGDLTSAATSFQDAFTALRGNPFIDYKQLNMPCKLYASEVNFNLGLIYFFSGDHNTARDYFRYAGGLQTDNTRHSAIPAGLDAVEKDRWEYFGRGVSERLIMLPENSFFRVSKAKMEGLQTSTKFMDQAKVVAAVNDDYDFVGFVGAKKLQQANNSGPQSPSPRRSNPPVGPPPSVPPPRLPPGLSSPARGKPQGRPSSPGRHASPSRPPPPSTPPPTMPKTAPPRPPPSREKSPSKAPLGPASGGVFSELRKNVDGILFKPLDPPPGRPKPPYTKVVKGPAGNNVASNGAPQTTTAKLNCEFNVTVAADASYEDLVAKIAEKLRQAASDLSNPIQRKSMMLNLEDPSKKTKAAVTSDSSFWRTTWSSMMKNSHSEPVLTLKESDKESRQHSPGLRPSRPPAIAHNAADDEEDHDVYHDIS